MRLIFSVIVLSVLSVPASSLPAQAMSQKTVGLAPDDLRSLVAQAADEQDLPEDFVAAVITIESSWKATAVNGSSLGLMQIKSSTARSLGFRGQTRELLDPRVNVRYGIAYLTLAWQASAGDVCATVARYQSGLDTSHPSRANKAYCRKVTLLMARDRKEDPMAPEG